MVMAAALVHGNEKTKKMVAFAPNEDFRSLQIYGSDPEFVGRAVRALCEQDIADHIDMNFGCPATKVTRKGGGAAVPVKRNLTRAIMDAAVTAAAPFGVPITCKFRIGINDDITTFLDTGKAAEDAGIAMIALHARTAEQMYEGKADWSAIARLVEHLKPTGTPVLGNGDIWSGADGKAMMEQTGCAGVVVGRGCLGRPWLFADLVEAFNGGDKKVLPSLHEVREVMYRHGELIVDYFESEDRGCRDLRKHMAWYLKGFRVPSELRRQFGMHSSLAELRTLLDQLTDQPYPVEVAEKPRGRVSHGRPPTLPDGWLNDPDENVAIELEDAISGG
jgi:nifR3 family TIM-barrel protein